MAEEFVAGAVGVGDRDQVWRVGPAPDFFGAFGGDAVALVKVRCFDDLAGEADDLAFGCVNASRDIW